MIKDWIFRHQKATMFIAAVLLAFTCYHFSFKKTMQAMLLHQKLNAEVNAQDLGMQSTLTVMERKQLDYTKILRKYSVRKNERENRMWQTISGLALLNEVSISFQPLKQTTDTISTKQQFNQEYQFNGNYSNLIQLLDTLHKSSDLGMMAKVKIFKDDKNPVPEQNIKMQLSFVGLERN